MKTTRMLVILVLALVVGLPAGVANADFIWGTPTNLGPTVNRSAHESGPNISADGLSLYFICRRAGGYGDLDIWVTTRATTDDPWGTSVNLGPTINTPVAIWGVSISSDGLSLYFDRGASGDIWVATRATANEPWEEPVNLGPTVNSPNDDSLPNISADELSLYFNSRRSGGRGKSDLWVTRRETTDEPWGTPVNLGPTVNSSAEDVSPSISADGLQLFFHSDRPGGYGQSDIYVTRRATTDDPWGTAVNLGPTVNSSMCEDFPNVSADGSTLYLSSDRPDGSGGWDLWQAPIIPIVDFNGDGIVDSSDMCIMVDYWHTDEPLCDIGPMPFGDGIVDVQDLIVLAEYLFTYPGAVAYWKLDETEGIVAQDSAGANDAYVVGGPLRKSTGGMVDGALEFDGIDDYVSSEFVLNPADGPFSVFAWIKGGAAGQVVIAQKDGVNWLCADPSEGNLMTELKGTGRGAAELLSQTIITDGDWHRIGLVWDGSNRTLYVDGVAVAEDTQTNLAASENGLYIGTGTAMEPGSYWSGLIDDVRIYNRAVTP